jgi:hypothetical protein
MNRGKESIRESPAAMAWITMAVIAAVVFAASFARPEIAGKFAFPVLAMHLVVSVWTTAYVFTDGRVGSPFLAGCSIWLWMIVEMPVLFFVGLPGFKFG